MFLWPKVNEGVIRPAQRTTAFIFPRFPLEFGALNGVLKITKFIIPVFFEIRFPRFPIILNLKIPKEILITSTAKPLSKDYNDFCFHLNELFILAAPDNVKHV